MVDGAAVDSLVYEALARTNPALVARTRVIERLGPYGIPPVVVRPGIDPRLEAEVREALLGMADDPRGQDALAALEIDRFVIIEDTAYNPVRQMAERMRWTH